MFNQISCLTGVATDWQKRQRLNPDALARLVTTIVPSPFESRLCASPRWLRREI
jgi:hypothetical protein